MFDLPNSLFISTFLKIFLSRGMSTPNLYFPHAVHLSAASTCAPLVISLLIFRRMMTLTSLHENQYGFTHLPLSWSDSAYYLGLPCAAQSLWLIVVFIVGLYIMFIVFNKGSGF